MTKIKNKEEVIIQSGISIFVEKGYGKTKVSDIAKHAGVGKGTVYEYFSSKDDIFRGCVDYILDNHIRKLKEEIDKKESNHEKLLCFGRIHFNHIYNRNNHIYYAGQECNQDMGKEIKKITLNYLDEALKIIEDIINGGYKARNISIREGELTPRDKALIFIGSINQYIVNQMAFEEDITKGELTDGLDSFIDRLLSTLHGGLLRTATD